jgi:ATP-dependent Clp protease ATP-binding subunit ClpC
MNDRFLPDKALDVLDEAAAMVRSRHGNRNYFKEIKALRQKEKVLIEHKEAEVENEEYEKALEIKFREDEIKKEIKKFYDLQSKENSARIKVPVTAREVGEVVQQMTGVPVNELLEEE